MWYRCGVGVVVVVHGGVVVVVAVCDVGDGGGVCTCGGVVVE